MNNPIFDCIILALAALMLAALIGLVWPKQ